MNSPDSAYHNLNALLIAKEELLSLASSRTSLRALEELDYDWESNTLNPNSEVFKILQRNQLTAQTGEQHGLTSAGRLLFSRLVVPFNPPEMASLASQSAYRIIKRLGVGKNSAIFSAEHALLKTRVILKLIRPGASSDILKSLQILNGASAKAHIVRPIDFFKTDILDAVGRKLTVECVVFPQIDGISFRAFLQQKSYHLNSHVAISFINQIGFSLAELERIGAYHGDLHDENIIVEETEAGELIFRLIDVSFGATGSLTTDECRNSDLSNFRQHVWRLLGLQKSFLPRMSLRKFLGTRQHLAISKILSGEAGSFREIMAVIADPAPYRAYVDDKNRFLSEKFNLPTTFRLQRYEEIIDPSVAARLFVPLPELMSKVTEFSNVYVSGMRGSGKSTYLAALAFFPHAGEVSVDFKELFGIYFPCRQGEFKSLTTVDTWTAEELRVRTTQVVIVKVIRRTLEALSGGVATSKIAHANDYSRLRDYLNRFLPTPGLVSVSHDILSEIDNFVSTMVRVEMELLSTFRIRETPAPSGTEANSLIEFFLILKDIFPELAGTRFHVLFDDAGLPNLPVNVQRIINDLILTSNPIFCIKFSAEKFTFSFQSSLGKIPENGHDYFEHDISQMLFIGSATAQLPRADLEKYFRKIVEQRLEEFRYKDRSIVAYLGDNPNIADQIIGLLAGGRKDAFYAGWTAIWNIADRTPRNLLEIVSEIFSYADITSDSVPRPVSIKIQDKAIRVISEKRLQSLSQIAGVVHVGQKEVSLGRRLFEVTACIGSTFRVYLKAERGKPRKRQHLAIERNDLDGLIPEAEEILEKLITFGVLDDTKSEFARDDEVKKPIYVLNRIYCPVFNIIYRRDEHLRLSKKRFELLLLNPQEFRRSGTKRLQVDHGADDLFGFKIYE